MASSNEEIVLTPAGLQKLQAELDELVNVRRPGVTERIREAKSLGDLSENFDYQDAKRDQSFVEGRIMQLKETLARARVVTQAEMPDGSVGLGAVVDLVNVDSGNKSSYTIVGAAESDPRQGKISNKSPVGQALMGHKVGETVQINTPRGAQTYRVTAISYNQN